MAALMPALQVRDAGAPPLERAIREIRQAESARADARGRKVRRRRFVAQIDQFILELEEMHLRGGQRVPNSMVQRLAGFLEQLPPECRGSFSLRTRIAYVIDDLFDVQERLLNRLVIGRDELVAEDTVLDQPRDESLQ
ncbi:MAG: hypothetical protein ACR2MY_01260 [Candidatus Dormibacteria bacterium]